MLLEAFQSVAQCAVPNIASYADAHYSMGLALTELGKLEEAAQEYRAVFRIRPGHAPARDSFGTLLWMLGKPDDALVQYADGSTQLSR